MPQYSFCYICSQREKTSSHLFPKSSARRKFWLNAFNLSEDDISKNTKVCGKHFEQDRFIQQIFPGRSIHLKRDAVPTLLLERRLSRSVNSQKGGNTTEKNMNGESELSVACLPPIKNFACGLCGLEFNEVRHLATHIKICKYGENPTDPLGAERRFSRSVNSQKRGNTTEKTMNEESDVTVACSPLMKNLVCGLCGFEFSDERHLTTHIKICKNGKNPTDPLGADTCPFEYVDCTQVCENQVDRVEITDVEIFRSQDLLDEHNIKCETLELTVDEKSEETDFTETYISDTYTGQPIVHLKTETPEEPIKCDYKAVKSSQLEERIKVLKKKKPLRRIKEIQGKCTICDFTSAYSLTRHMRTHTGEKPYKCTLCDNAYTERCKLTHHMKKHTGEKPFKCSECDIAGVNSNYLTVHMRMHTGEKPFKCTVCDNAFAQRSKLTQHIKSHTGERPFKCPLCDYASTTRSLLTRHMLTHGAEKPFKCSLCNYSCTDRYNLMLHMRRHTGERPFKCTICDYTCTQRGYLRYHMQTHAAEKQFKCTLCDYACGRRTRLREHMRKHTKKQFQCTLCDYAGTDRYKLMLHMRRHTGEKPFKCTICDYACPRREYLTYHMQTHAAVKEFKCTICDYACARKARLREHIKKKHMKKQFQCTLCHYSTAKNNRLVLHNMLMHGICENIERESN